VTLLTSSHCLSELPFSLFSLFFFFFFKDIGLVTSTRNERANHSSRERERERERGGEKKIEEERIVCSSFGEISIDIVTCHVSSLRKCNYLITLP